MSRDLDDWHYGAAGGAAAGSSEASMGGGGEAAGDSHDNDLVMPGFRFHPTEEELIEFYLRRKVEGRRFNVDLIADLDLYCFDPWELPARAVMGGKEWFFYVPRDRKYRNGDRPNRVTASGYWKATGADRMIRGENNRPIGLKKTLVFYSGKAPKGVRSSWIMNEYRLPPPAADAEPLTHKSEISLCRVYKRSGIDDGRGQPSSSSTQASAGRRTRSGRHMSTSPASSPLSPIPSSFHLLQGECPSASPPAIMDQMMITADNVSQLVLPPTARAFAPPGNSLAAVAPAEGATILASTDSLLNMAAVPMGISGPVDKLGTVVGDSQAYANHISAATGSDFLPLPSTQPMSQVAPLGALPMTAPLSSVDDKLGWDWNPVPDTTTRDYRTSIFK